MPYATSMAASFGIASFVFFGERFKGLRASEYPLEHGIFIDEYKYRLFCT